MYKILQRNLKIEQHKSPKNMGGTRVLSNILLAKCYT